MIKSFFKSVIPKNIRAALRLGQKILVYRLRYYRIKASLIRASLIGGGHMRIIVGAAMTHQKGWYSTNEQWLDIAKPQDWDRIFKGKVVLQNVLAEHVIEHLTRDETIIALSNISRHMVPGGRVRIAVPDGYHPDPDYIKNVNVCGIGPDAEDHKQLLNVDTLFNFLNDAGFDPELLEGYLRNGKLEQKNIDPSYGLVMRSRGNSSLIEKKSDFAFVDSNTSLIVDGIRRFSDFG
jgi:predicted SAM-dependent methyltransferase